MHGHIKIKVTNQEKESAPFLKIEVEDSGIGIKNPDKIGTLFKNLEIINDVN